MKKLFLILCLLLPVSAQGNEYEVFLGTHDVQWFAYRMQIKAKRAGYPYAVKKEIRPNIYEVTLGPFKTEAEAQLAESKIKAIVKDLKARVQKVKTK